jgi:hypothetical protein
MTDCEVMQVQKADISRAEAGQVKETTSLVRELFSLTIVIGRGMIGGALRATHIVVASNEMFCLQQRNARREG